MSNLSKSDGVLLLGASGFFGPALADEFGGSVLGKTYSTRAIPGGLSFDARTSSVENLVASLPGRPQAAVVMLGETNIDRCAKDPVGTAEVNVAGVIRVIRELVALEILPVFTSSDGVLDGARALTREEDAVHPILTYGRQKLEVERYLADLRSPWLAVRLPKLLSIQADPRCMLTKWMTALENGDRIVCATDQYFSLAATVDAARAVGALVRSGARGLFHVAGPERLSRRSLLQAVLDEYRRFAQPSVDIAECSLREVNVLEPRPLDTSLNCERLYGKCGRLLRSASDVAREAVRARFSEKAAA